MNTSEQPMSDGLQEPTTQTPEAGSTAPEILPPSSPMPRKRGSDQIKAIEALLAGDDPEPEPETAPEGSEDGQEPDAEGAEAAQRAEGAEDAQEPPEKPATLNELAEKLDMAPEDLYSLAINTRDGEQVSIGALKDAYQEQDAARAEIAQKADAIKRREAGLVTDVQALGVLDAMQALPENIRQQANAHLVEMAEREYSNFLQLYPDLQQDSNRIAFETGIDEWLGEYGLSQHHFPIRNVAMYRLIKDALEARRELKAIKTPKPKPAPQSVSNRKRAMTKARPQPQTGSRGRQAELQSIANILKGS